MERDGAGVVNPKANNQVCLGVLIRITDASTRDRYPLETGFVMRYWEEGVSSPDFQCGRK